MTTPKGRLRPPVAPAASTAGSTGSTQGESAVPAPAISAKRMSKSTSQPSVLPVPLYVTAGPADQLRPLPLRLAAGTGELHRALDPLQLALPRKGVVEGITCGLLRRLVDQDAARAGDVGDPAGEIDRAPVPVARLREGGAARDPGSQQRELLSLLLAGLDHARSRLRRGRRVARDQHRRVPDQLDQAHRRLRDRAGDLLQPARDHSQLLDGNLLTELGEVDQVDEDD